ncbi:MAG: hypothetical protein OHK0044_03120 [Burkholderiaceae bacterium]
MGTTTKIFKSGGSQAVRIPKEYRLEGHTVAIDRAGEGLLIRPVSGARKRAGRTASAPVRPRRPGSLKGLLKIGADFDAPLPSKVLKTFGES